MYKNLDETKAFNNLLQLKEVDLIKELNEKRIKKYNVKSSKELNYNYASMPINDEILDSFQDLVDEIDIINRYKDLLSGNIANPGENRKVLHHLTRGNVLNKKIIEDKIDLDLFYKKELEKVFDFSTKVRNGEITGSTGKKIKNVVQIGIGGSDLGPRALYLALETYNPEIKAYFISNVDPCDANLVFRNINCEETLFILVSKSGTTLETLTNKELIFDLIKKENKDLILEKHMIAVTSKTSPLANDDSLLASFFINDYIGGRYSSTSSVGMLLLSICYGKDIAKELLEGAHDNDVNSLEKDIRKNASLLDALIGVYLRNVLDYPSTAILPYSQALNRFPAHLQQVDMESNGKSVNFYNNPINYYSGPVIFGECGTNGQHSFYQLLHQGTDIIPLQFIGFTNSQTKNDIVINNSTSQEKLNANLIAQIVGFAMGKDSDNPNKVFEGNRVSSLLYGKKLTPYALGSLLAHFENKIMFQGFIWNLNSFDQEGVQLGKKLANEVLDGCKNNKLLKAYLDLF